MLSLRLSPVRTSYKVLCLGAHCDDIEIGCGGTLLKVLQQYDDVSVYWVTFSSDSEREPEARASAEMLLERAKEKNIVVKRFRNGFFPYHGSLIKEFFEELKQQLIPDLIFTHYRNDLHQDHRVISELTWNTFRDHLVLEYEIPKYDGDLGTPNFFVHLDEALAHRKTRHIMKFFESQREKHWFDEQMFLGMMRLRGMESCSRYAEAFYSRKLLLG